MTARIWTPWMTAIAWLFSSWAWAAGPPPPPDPEPTAPPPAPASTDTSEPTPPDEGEPDQPSEPDALIGGDDEPREPGAAAREHDDDDDDDGDDDDDDDDDENEQRPKFWRSKYLTIEGYVQPQYTFRQRSGTRPRFRREFGAEDTRAGIKFGGEPVDRWSYRIHLVFGSRMVNLVRGVSVIDYEGDGVIEGLDIQEEVAPGITIEQLWVDYQPVRFVQSVRGKDMEIVGLHFTLGQMRAPFTRQNQTQNDNLLFPRRNQISNVFRLVPDLGGQTELHFADRRARLTGGIFNGTGLAFDASRERGPLYAGRVDIEPLGEMAQCECDILVRRFLFGVGGSLLYRPYRLFDEVGNDTLTRVRDLYASASVRLAAYGFYAQGEFIRRQRTDNLSERPFISTGAYGQMTYFFRINETLGLAPLGNVGWVLLDEASNPQRRYFTQDGIALYMANDVYPDALRVSLLYLGEWRLDEQESAQGGTVQIQLKF